jgi:hypothetical protein
MKASSSVSRNHFFHDRHTSTVVNILTKISYMYYILQAYTVELELELNQLKEENAKLKKIVVIIN